MSAADAMKLVVSGGVSEALASRLKSARIGF